MIDLSKNENPMPVSSCVERAISDQVANIRRYPAAMGEAARMAAAACFDVGRDQIALTRGIDAALDDLIGLYRGKRFVVVSPGFHGFTERLTANGIVPSVLTLDDRFRLPEAQTETLDKDCFALIASPNNPTGHRFSGDELNALQDRCHGLLIDQTYDDFATKPVVWPAMRENTYRFRSFSKGYGLAGLRIGALIGTAPDIARITDRQQYCHIDTLAGQAIIAVSDQIEFRTNVAGILRPHKSLADGLTNIGFDVLAGEGNFVLVRHDAAGQLTAFLKSAGILVKDTGALGLPGHVRISVGTDRDHDALFEALTEYRRGLSPAH